MKKDYSKLQALEWTLADISEALKCAIDNRDPVAVMKYANQYNDVCNKIYKDKEWCIR